MKYLKIQNKGQLDIRLVALMGGTTKTNQETKIGQFGTGLKYVLAYLIRNNIDFKFFSGINSIDITIEQEVIKEEEFNIICINGNRTSITDKMGLEWEAWMIIRELWCNALDEGESLRDIIQDEPVGIEDCTTVYIQVTSEVKDVLENWSKYFIENAVPLFEYENCIIYKGEKHLKVYKQGILIHEDKEQPSLFYYDILNANINELREYRGYIRSDISKAILGADVALSTYILENITDEHLEAELHYEFYKFSDGWKEAIGSAKLIHPDALTVLKERIKENFDDYIVVPKSLYKALSIQFPGVGALRVSDKVHEFYEVYDEKLETKVKQALVILEQVGYEFSPELKFYYGVFGNKDTRARINLDSKEVFISERIKDLSLFELCSVLIEENEHFRTAYSDCSREFQQHFIDLYLRVLLDKHKVTI